MECRCRSNTYLCQDDRNGKRNPLGDALGARANSFGTLGRKFIFCTYNKLSSWGNEATLAHHVEEATVVLGL